ncbi:5-oxoprolinase subunit PxpB [Microbulbifer guangxiensis]|uniref:5-oxoprolinase subunit PxpB n=1 Tax=Microbulbifer guangxiensis TaxID=2904249 RepID=UPI001F20F076|nr:5-oxoprolinase subunit PxpB [Microbulbifer guangxiensis]
MWQLQDAGDESIIIYLAQTPNETVLQRIRLLVDLIRDSLAGWVTDVVPSYCSITVYYDVLHCDAQAIARRLTVLLQQFEADGAGRAVRDSVERARQVELPVFYGREVAPDLQRVAEFAGRTVEEVVRLHSETEFRVYALGFRPGFAYMGETPELLRVPRLDTPRRRVPMGAVAIAGPQAAVYPCESPGGWNLIGRCPVALFDRREDPPRVLLQVGDRVRFTPVDRATFLELGGVLDG